MKSSLLKLNIKRFNREKDPSDWVQTFYLEPRKGMNLLEALLRLQDEEDASLCFRYSCRGAVCGSCAMRVNGNVLLACRTPVEGLKENPILIEPLPYFPVIRDLVVDMTSLFESYQKIEPYLHKKSPPPLSEFLMDEAKREEIDPYVNCILCGICFGVCPSFEGDPRFLGPAILAKAYRFYTDPRDRREKEISLTLDGQKGVWGCKTVFNCVRACPKEVPPTRAIVAMRRNILKFRLFSLIPSLFRRPSGARQS